jgi:hypothetical protein
MPVFTFTEGPQVADSGLSHRNIVVQRGESAQKTTNGKNRPVPDTRRNVCLENEVHESGPSA